MRIKKLTFYMGTLFIKDNTNEVKKNKIIEINKSIGEEKKLLENHYNNYIDVLNSNINVADNYIDSFKFIENPNLVQLQIEALNSTNKILFLIRDSIKESNDKINNYYNQIDEIYNNKIIK